MSFFISNAFADTATTAAAAPHQGSSMSSILMLAAFIVLFYFLLWWPQSKKLKAHRQLVSNLAKEDEVITNAGILGKITHIHDDFIKLQIAPSVEISIQKASIATTVPKGTFKL
jgi:preprotein translocase subunit YajC